MKTALYVLLGIFLVASLVAMVAFAFITEDTPACSETVTSNCILGGNMYVEQPK